ncbi:MAG: J domain-containing protein [Spirochaetaceae bacterium]|jgi:DnaJ-domain-containing protein 1|nr:J domain-containing protein [Spirochaetaceae bacterium]
MGIIERLADLVRSYLLEDEGDLSTKPSGRTFTDPDAAAAYDDLNDFLKGGNREETFSSSSAGSGSRSSAGSGFSGGAAGEHPASGGAAALARDFAELGLAAGASADECKTAYKRLLKIHHPDRHAGHDGNMRKATEKSARINAAFDRIERWRRTGKAD